MSFQKSPDLQARLVSRLTGSEHLVNRHAFVTSPSLDGIDEIVAAARAECADFFTGLRVPGFERSARRHG